MTAVRARQRDRLARAGARLRLPATPTGRIVLAVALVAFLNGAAWSLLTPPFQVPDETAHFAYAQHLAETGRRAGEPGRNEFSSEQTAAMAAMGSLGLIGRPLGHPPDAGAPDRDADAAIRAASRDVARSDGGGPSTASSQPALYYALAAIPHELFAWASLPVRLEAMRLLSAMLFALAAAAAALVVAEVLPRRPWAMLVGGLAIALSPYSAFIASGVTPDVLLMLTATLTLLVATRTIRRSVTPRRAAALGFVVGAGVMTKLTYVAMVPPALLVFAAMLWRDRRVLAAEHGGVLRTAAAGVGAALVLPAIFVVWLKIIGMPLQQAGTSTPGLPAAQVKPPSTREMLSYTWQLYLPRLPWQIDLFGYDAPSVAWVEGFAGRFGWLDYGIAPAVGDWFARLVDLGLVLGAAAAVWCRRALWRNRILLAAYALFAAALMLVVGKAGYDYHRTTGLVFEQPRYLFPVAGLFALAVAFGCQGLGRRMAPIVACVLIGLLVVHDLAGLWATLGRYYG